MTNQFSRTAILLGVEAMQKLKNSSVAIFGVGGVGGYVAEALARSGVGTLDLFDNDTVSKTNINRQIYALHSTIGQYKTEVAAKRIADINPEAVVNCHKVFYMPDNADKYDLSKYNYIIDAIDTVTAKIELVVRAQKADVPIISSMGTGNKLDPLSFEVTDIFKTTMCPLAKVMRYELKKRGIKKLKVIYSKEKPLTPLSTDEVSSKRQVPGSTAFVPSVAGLIIASEVIKDLI